MKSVYWKVVWVLITLLSLAMASGAPSSVCASC